MNGDQQSVLVTGPDGKSYQFPAGTDKAAAVAYFKKKGIGVPAAAAAPPATVKPRPQDTPPADTPPTGPRTSSAYARAAKQKARENQYQVTYGGTPYQGTRPPYYGFTPSNIAGSVGQAAIDTAKFGRDVAKDVTTRFPESLMGKDTTYSRFIERPSDVAAAKASEAMAAAKHAQSVGELSKAIGYGAGAAIPGVGPLAVDLGEQAGQGDIGGAAGKAVGMYGTGRLASEATGAIKSTLTNPQAFYDYAAKVDTELLKSADQVGNNATKAQKLAPGLRVAREGIISRWKNMGRQIEAARVAKHTQVQDIARAADAAGKTIDIDQAVKDVESSIPPELRSKFAKTMQAVKNRLVPGQGGQPATWQPRNLRSVRLSEAMEIQRTLDQPLERMLGSNYPKALDSASSAVRNAIGDRIGAAEPELQRLRSEESELIKARSAARELETKQLNGNFRTMRGLIYGSVGTAGLYIALKTLGVGWMPAIVTSMTLATLYRSAPSATARAALAAKWGELMDTSYAQARAAGGFQTPQAPGTAMQVTPRQQVQPRQQLTGGPGGGGGAPPGGGPPGAGGPINMGVAPSQVVTPPLLGRGTLQLPESASRASKGSGQYTRVPKEPQGSYLAEKAKAEAAAKAPQRSVAESNIKPQASPEKAKAMMDRLDTIQNTTPKSGAHANALKREAAEIKGVLSGDIKGKEATKVNKRIADRERLAGKRETAKAENTPEVVAQATQAGSASMAQSPEEAMIQREQLRSGQRDALLTRGYQELGKFEGGPEMVKAMKKLASDMAKIDPEYDEMSALADAIKALKSATGK